MNQKEVNIELMDIYNDDMIKTNIVKSRDSELSKGEYHLSIHLWLINNKKILIQKRSKIKKISPNMWSIVTGGAIVGENAEEACIRECVEEIGISIKNVKNLGIIKRKYDFVNVFISKELPNINNISINEEVEECKIVSLNEFKEMIKKGEVIDSIIYEFYKFIEPTIKGE